MWPPKLVFDLHRLLLAPWEIARVRLKRKEAEEAAKRKARGGQEQAAEGRGREGKKKLDAEEKKSRDR